MVITAPVEFLLELFSMKVLTNTWFQQECFMNYFSINPIFLCNWRVYLFSILTYEFLIYLCATALDSSSNDSYGVWKIDDKDNSFLTQPFRIKYARQDVRLCMMVSFTMPLERYEVSVFLSFCHRWLSYNDFFYKYEG